MKKTICLLMICFLIFQIASPILAYENSQTVTEGMLNDSKWLTLSQNTTGARYFVDSLGNPVQLFGMARCQSHADSEDLLYSSTADVNSLTKHYSDLNCNFMRLAIECSEICQEGGGVSTDDINRFISNKIDPDVQAIIRSGMYVMLDVHMYPPTAPEDEDGAEYTVQYAYDNYIPLLTELAKKYADEPMVAVIEIWNEPYPADQTTLEYNRETWNELVRQFYIDAVSEIRKYDKRHVLLVSDYNAGWGTAVPETWKGYYTQVDPEYNNTAFSIHASAEQLDTDFEYYSAWYKTTAANNNLCLLFGEIETEGELMTEAGLQNLISFFSETKDEFHFSGALWRPHSDEANYVYLWKEWISDYAEPNPVPILREIIETENFSNKNTELVYNNLLFGRPNLGTGIQLIPNSETQESSITIELDNKIYQAGTYSITVTALGDAESSGGFTLGYRTASGNICSISEMQGNQKAEIYNQTVSFSSDERISDIVISANQNNLKSVLIDRVYLIADYNYSFIERVKSDANFDSIVDSRDLVRVKKYVAGETVKISADAVDCNLDGKINAPDITYIREGLLGNVQFVWTENTVETVNSLVLDANHWTPESKNYTLTDTGITMGNSDYVDAHYSSFYNAGTVSLTEDSENGNYITFTVPDSWNAAPVLRYGPNGVSDVSVATKGAEYVYMTVKFDADNLSKFQKAGAYSKNVIDNTIADYNYIADNAFVVSLGGACGVTFTTWKAALKNITANEWTTLKLAITAGENVSVADTVKIFEFFFGKPADINGAQMSVKNIRVCTEDGVFATYNANVAIDSSVALRFNSVVDKYQIPTCATNIRCGTLIALDELYNNDYAAFGIGANDVINIESKKTVTYDNIISFTASLTDISNNLYCTDFAARPYVKYILDGKEVIIYGDVFVCNVCDVIENIVATGQESDKMTKALTNFINRKIPLCLSLNDGPEYVFLNNAWAPQLQIATVETAVKKSYGYISMDIKCVDIESLIDAMKDGSKENINGSVASDGMDYSGEALGIYFYGTDIKSVGLYTIGVTQRQLKAAFETNRAILANGETVTLILPLENGDKFKTTSVISGFNMMLTHGSNIANVKDKSISISNVCFLNIDS